MRTLVVTGPAADLSGLPNLNGITATPDGKTLFVAHSALGGIFTVEGHYAGIPAANGSMRGIAIQRTLERCNDLPICDDGSERRFYSTNRG